MPKKILTRSNSVPLFFPDIIDSNEKILSNKFDKSIKSLYQLQNLDSIKIQSQLSIENQDHKSSSPSKICENKLDIETLRSPRLISRKVTNEQTDPYRVIKITEIIEINNSNNKSDKNQQDTSNKLNEKNIELLSKLNIHKEKVKSIQNTNYKVSPNGSLYELNDKYLNPEIKIIKEASPVVIPEIFIQKPECPKLTTTVEKQNENCLDELKRRNENLENEIKLMKEKFSQTQLMLELIKSERKAAENDFQQENVQTMPVVHNFSFIKSDEEVTDSQIDQQKPKKISIKIFGRTRSQSSDKHNLKEIPLNATDINLNEPQRRNNCEPLQNQNNLPQFTKLNSINDTFIDNGTSYAKRSDFKNQFFLNENPVQLPLPEKPNQRNLMTSSFTYHDKKGSDQTFPRRNSNEFKSDTKSLKLSNNGFDLDKFKSYLKQLNMNNNIDNGSPCNRSSSMPISQLRNNSKQIFESRPGITSIRSKPIRPIISNWNGTSGEIIGNNNSAFSSVKTLQKAIHIDKIISLNDNFYKESSHYRETGTISDESEEAAPVWSYRTNSLLKNEKKYENLKKPNLNQHQQNKSSFTCGLLNKFFLNDGVKTQYSNNEESFNKYNNLLYKEEDDNYEKNNSPSLSIASSDIDNTPHVFKINTGDDKTLQKNVIKEEISQEREPDPHQKILKLIETYLDKNNKADKNTSQPYESYLLKKISEKEKTSSLPTRQIKPQKKINTYYNNFYKEQFLNNLSLKNESDTDTETTNSKSDADVSINAKYIDEEDYSDDYDALKRNSVNVNDRKSSDGSCDFKYDANEEFKSNFTTFLSNKQNSDSESASGCNTLKKDDLNKTPKLSRRVIFADEVI